MCGCWEKSGKCSIMYSGSFSLLFFPLKTVNPTADISVVCIRASEKDLYQELWIVRWEETSSRTTQGFTVLQRRFGSTRKILFCQGFTKLWGRYSKCTPAKAKYDFSRRSSRHQTIFNFISRFIIQDYRNVIVVVIGRRSEPKLVRAPCNFKHSDI